MMLKNTVEVVKIVFFSEASAERDTLRRFLNPDCSTVISFEKVSVCIDNLASISPHVVIIKTEHWSVVRRFALALIAIQIPSSLLVVSDSLCTEIFSFAYDLKVIKCVPTAEIKKGLEHLIAASDFETEAGSKIKQSYIGESDAIKNIKLFLPKVRLSMDPVLITGEVGTGKELLSRCIMQDMENEAFSIKIDCANLMSINGGDTISDQLQMANLLTKNSPSHQNRVINILFNSVDQLSPMHQSELLILIERLEERGYLNELGQCRGVRLIATSSLNLEKMASQGIFRKELYYRLNVIPVYLPPLSKRPNDIPILIDYFTIQCCDQLNKCVVFFSDQMKNSLISYSWPGNIDELRQWSRRVVISGDESIMLRNGYFGNPQNHMEPLFQEEDLKAMFKSIIVLSKLAAVDKKPLKAICKNAIAETEKMMVAKALEVAKWNRKKAAVLLNISYKSILNKMKMYQI